MKVSRKLLGKPRIDSWCRLWDIMIILYYFMFSKKVYDYNIISQFHSKSPYFNWLWSQKLKPAGDKRKESKFGSENSSRQSWPPKKENYYMSVEKFHESNFLQWQFQIKCALKSKGQFYMNVNVYHNLEHEPEAKYFDRKLWNRLWKNV